MLPDKATILKKLIAADLIDRKQVSDVVGRCKNRKEDIYAELVSRVSLPAERIGEFFQENFHVQKIILTDLVLNQRLINKIPTYLIITHLIIPVCRINGKVLLAVADPLDIDGLQAITEYTGSEIGVLLSSKEHIIQAISEYIFRPKIISLLK